MSVINQMLNQLEQRGAHTTSEQTMVRAVPQTRRSFTLPVLVLGLVLALGIAAWQWVEARKQDAASAAVATKAMRTASTNKPDKPTVQLAAAIIAPEPDVLAASLPASRLSFELSSVPLPSAARQAIPEGEVDKVVAKKQSEAKKSVRKPGKPAKQVEVTVTEVAQPDDMPIKQVSLAQKADAEFRKAAALMRQGRTADALAGYEMALRLDAGHDAARQAMVALLLDSKRGGDAERVLQERLNDKPDHIGFTMMLARLQVERGAVAEATATLEKALPYARSQADYQAFLAAVLQRQGRNEEAIKHYQVVLQIAPNNGIWLMGYGISLQAVQRNDDAKAAFQNALDTQTLSPELQGYVRQKLKGL